MRLYRSIVLTYNTKLAFYILQGSTNYRKRKYIRVDVLRNVCKIYKRVGRQEEKEYLLFFVLYFLPS